MALGLNSQSSDVYYARGQTYLALKQYSKAVADFTAAIGLRPDFADAYYNRGLAYDRLKQHDKAAADYSEVIRLSKASAAVVRQELGARIQELGEAGALAAAIPICPTPPSS